MRLEVSHELRTPLHAILGNVELLLDGSAGPLSSEARACLDDVRRAGQHLLAQAADLQLLIEAMASPAPAAEAGFDVVAGLREALRHHGATRPIEVAPEDAALAVRGDPCWLETLTRLIAASLGAAAGSAGHAARIALARARGATGEMVLLRVVWGAEMILPPLRLGLIDAILRLHGGCAHLAVEDGLTLVWPAQRILAPDDGARARGPGAADHAV